MTDQALEDCVRAAIAAPSIYNSQPWRFRIRDGGIDVFADWQRRLEIIDGPGRELLMSIGAALFNLRVVISGLSRQPITRLFPDSAKPELIARVVPAPPAPASDSLASLASLAEAIPRRHTNRRPFSEAEIPVTILEEFAAAVRREGATLHIATPAGRHAILDLARTAERHLRSRGVYRAELTGRSRPAHGGFGGVPAKAHGPWQAIEVLPLRDFGLTEPQPRRSIDPYERYPTIVVLSTDADRAEDWVTAGQALERLLLVATQRGVAATPMSQPLEIPQLRHTVAEAGGWPQLILCLGYAPPGTPAPRRTLADVLIKTAG